MYIVPSWEKSDEVGRADGTDGSSDWHDSLKDSLCNWFIEVYFELLCYDVEVNCREVNEGVPEIEFWKTEHENVVKDEHWIFDFSLGTLAKDD